jgi:hypothetical protein
VLTGNAAKTTRRLLDLADQLGAEVPKPVRAEHDKLAALADKVRTLDLRHDLAGVTLAALEDGRDPFGDPAVVAELTRTNLSRQQTALTDALTERAGAFLAEHAAQVWAAFRGPFGAAADTLRTALAALGPLDLADTAAVLARGGDAADVWAAATRAEATVRHVRSAWKLLGAASSSWPAEPARHRLLIIADVPAERWANDRLDGTSLGAWDALRAGYPLSLADGPADLKRRMSAIADLRAERDQQAARNRQSRAFGGPRVKAAS